MNKSKDVSFTLIVPISSEQADRVCYILDWLKFAEKYSTCSVIVVIDNYADLYIGQMQEEFKNWSCVKRVLEVKCGNPGGARNKAMQFVDTEWFQFVDSDDYVIVPNIIEAIERSKAFHSVIVGGYSKIDSKLITKTPSRLMVRWQLTFELGLWRILMRTKDFKNIYFPELRMAEDQVYFIRAKILAKKIFVSKLMFYRYQVNQKNSLTSNIVNSNDIVEAIRLIKLHQKTEEDFSIYSRILLMKLQYSSRKRNIANRWF